MISIKVIFGLGGSCLLTTGIKAIKESMIIAIPTNRLERVIVWKKIDKLTKPISQIGRNVEKIKGKGLR